MTKLHFAKIAWIITWVLLSNLCNSQ